MLNQVTAILNGKQVLAPLWDAVPVCSITNLNWSTPLPTAMAGYVVCGASRNKTV